MILVVRKSALPTPAEVTDGLSEAAQAAASRFARATTSRFSDFLLGGHEDHRAGRCLPSRARCAARHAPFTGYGAYYGETQGRRRRRRSKRSRSVQGSRTNRRALIATACSACLS